MMCAGMKTELPGSVMSGNVLAASFSFENAPMPQPAPAKRKAMSNEAKDVGDAEDSMQKRTRGRPRLDTKDETAADRRRTQIRLAQRAYRHRKDNAITSLEEKVKELEKTNADMSREFHKFYDLVLAEGLLGTSPDVAARFKNITDNFMRLTGCSSGEAGYISPEDERATVLDGFCAPAVASSGSSGRGHSPLHQSTHGSIEGNFQTAPYDNETRPQAFNSYEIVAQATPDNASFPLYTMMDSASNLSSFATLTSPLTTLPIANSLSYQEVSFSRRLQRRTTERGLFLASMANPPPERYAAVFGFSLLFDSRECIARQLSEQLSNLIMPFQDQANPHKGPYEEKMDQRVRLTFGFEKEFLNADEIELYLRQRGIVISQQMEFVDAEVDESEFQDVMPSIAGSGSFSSQSTGYGSQPNEVPVSMAMAMKAASHNPMMNNMDINAAEATGLLPYMCQTDMGAMWHTPWTRPKVTISVGVLVEELASRSVCMGRHPGVRIRDVNRAIRVAAGLA